MHGLMGQERETSGLELQPAEGVEVGIDASGCRRARYTVASRVGYGTKSTSHPGDNHDIVCKNL